MHKKSRSIDSFDRDESVSINNEEDNFSDTDNEEQWEEESMLPVRHDTDNANQWEKESLSQATQTTYV